MSDEYNDLDTNTRNVIRADSVIEALLGVIIEDSGAVLAEALDDSETGIDITGVAPTAGDIWKLEDELILVDSFSAPTATVTRGHDSTTAASHAATVKISRKSPAVHIEPRLDHNEYHKSELPVVALATGDDNDDDVFTMGQFEKTYRMYLEVIDMGPDMATVVSNVKRIMAEVKRLMREEKDSATPINSVVDDVRVGAAQLMRGKGRGQGMFVAQMFTTIEFEIIAAT